MKKISLYTWLAVGCSLLSVFSFSSCSKDTPEPDYAAGHVLEYGTDKPLSGAKVYLAACSGDFLGPISCKIIDSATALSDGSFTMKPGGSLVEAHMPGYFTDLESQKTVTTQPEDIRLYPHAWLRVKLKNESGLAGFSSYQLIDGYPPRVYQSKGDSLYITTLLKGNTDIKLIFALYQDSINTTRDISTLKVMDVFSNKLPIDTIGALDFKIAIPGHDTTDLTIIY